MKIRLLLLATFILAAATVAGAASGTRTVHHSMSEFLDGELDGLSVGPTGELHPAPVSLTRYFTPALYIWSMALDRKGQLIAGTGDDGSVVREDGDEFVELARFPDQLVTDLVDTEHGILAATGPQGRVYRIGSDDADPAIVLQREETTVWALVESADRGKWLAGVGPEAALVRFDPEAEGEGEIVVEYSATMVSGLLRTEDSLWLSTEGPAMLLQCPVDEDEPTNLRFDAREHEIPAMVADGQGGLWFLVLNSGNPDIMEEPSTRLMHIGAEGSAEMVWRGAFALMSLAMASDGALLAGEIGGSRVHRIGRDGRVGLWRDFGSGDASSLLTDGDVTWIGSANLGDLFRLAPPRKGRGIFTSPVIETRAVQGWGRLWVEGSGDGVRFSVRSGMRFEPDATWSEWSGWLEDGEQMEAPLADYLQYRLELDEVELTAVSLAWSRRNHAPRIRGVFFEDNNSSEYDWSNGDSNGYGGNGDGNGSKAEILRNQAQIFADAEDPDGDALRTTVEVQQMNGGPWYPLARDVAEQHIDWDTRQFEDGIWRARVSVRDDAGDSGGLMATLVSMPVRIDNTPPRLVTSSRDGSVLKFRIEDPGSRIERVEFRRDGEEEFRRLEPVDGVIDAPVEEFELTLGKSTVAVWIRVRDVAGNEAMISPRLDD